MENLLATYPSFLKSEPLIWGINLSDLFRLSGVMVFMQIIGASQLVILGTTIIFYLGLIAVRKFFPRRYFEFLFNKRKIIKRSTLNEKIQIV